MIRCLRCFTVILIAVFFLPTLPAMAQRQFFIVGNYDFNGPISSQHYLRNGRVLSDHYWAGKNNTQTNPGVVPFDYYLGIHYRASTHMGIESGIHRSEYQLGMHDASYQQRNNVADINDPDPGSHQGLYSDQGSFFAFQNFNGEYVSGYYFFGVTYISVGVDYSRFPGSNPSMTSTYVSPSGEKLQVDVRYPKKFLSPFVEFLWGGYVGNVLFTSYFKFYAAGKVISADYSDTQNGTVIASDHVSQNGDRLALGLRFGLGTTGRSKIEGTHSGRYERAVNRMPRHKKVRRHQGHRSTKKRHKAKDPDSVPQRNPDNVRDPGHS